MDPISKALPSFEDPQTVLKNDFQFFLKEQHEIKIESILKASANPKVMVIDPDLMDPIGHMISVSKLKSLGVAAFYSLYDVNFNFQNHDFIYLVHVNKRHLLANIFLNRQNSRQIILNNGTKKLQGATNLHTLYIFPRKSLSLQADFERHSLVDKSIRIKKYALNIFPLKNDLLSLESKATIRTIINHGDQTPALNLADGICRLEHLFGKIPEPVVKGTLSASVAKFLLNRELNLPYKIPTNRFFCRLTLIDRTEDLITPFLTPSTYGGLMDEFFVTKNHSIDVEGKSEVLEPGDTLYARLENAHIDEIKGIITKELEEIAVIEKKSKALLRNPQCTPSEIVEAGKLAQQRDVRSRRCSVHIRIGEALIKRMKNLEFQALLQQESNILMQIESDKTLEFIENMIVNNCPINQVLRLFCLYTQVYGKMKSQLQSHFFREIIHNYGYVYFLTLRRIEQLLEFKKMKFSKACREFRLFEMFNPNLPENIAYTYNGYAPLSCRLVESVLAQPAKTKDSMASLELVCFVGGATRAEISACRKISDKIVVLTTEIINGNAFIESFHEDIDQEQK